MRGPRFVLLTTALLTIAGGSYAAATPPEGVRFTDGAESAMVRRNRLLPWHALPANTRVPDGAEVRCEKPCTLKVDAENRLSLSPGAVVSVGDYFYVPLVPGASLVPAHQVELREGLVEAFSPSDRSIPLVVSVDASQHVAVRAARVQISEKNDRLGVGVISGTARVGANRSWITVEKGQTTTILPNSKPNVASPLPAPPEWLPAGGSCMPALSMSEPGALAVVGGCWKTVPGSVSYQVELARDAEFHAPLGAPEMVQVSSWSKILPAGHYFARASAIDANGLSGQISAVRQLVVIPCKLPPGASANMGTRSFVIPEGREISFGDTTGLELALDKGGFSRAPKSVRMDGEAEHELRLRLKDDPSSVSTMLMTRRALKAEVSLTPRMAQWPNDPIQISVTIVDPSGQMDPAKVEAQLSVMVGLTEVQLNWAHHGAVWSARVDPRNVGGPTVLRVIAKDEFGTQIGRNFLEISHPSHAFAVQKLDGQRVADN